MLVNARLVWCLVNGMLVAFKGCEAEILHAS